MPRRTPSPDLATKVRFLREPTTYSDAPGDVEARESHTSWIFLVGNLVYKLKKPLHYDFLDFSTVAARRHNCEEEVRLNRRFATDVYLGTVALTVSTDGALALGAAGEPVDWLVKMRRLPEEEVFENRLTKRTLDTKEIVRVASRLSRFYQKAPTVAMTPAAYVARFDRDIRANGRELGKRAYGLPRTQIDKIAENQCDFIERQEALLAERVQSGRIVEGHGDLRPEHIYVGPQPIIIDCLEFNRELRLLDPLDELGFLAMECERLGTAFVGQVLFDEYERATRDHARHALVHFYMSYRALLWANLAIRHIERLGAASHRKWVERASTYLRLAEMHIGGAARTG